MRVINRPAPTTAHNFLQNQPDPTPPPDDGGSNDSFLPGAAAVVGGAAGVYGGFHLGARAGIAAGILLTSQSSPPGQLFTNMVWGARIGAVVGIASVGALGAIAAYEIAKEFG